MSEATLQWHGEEDRLERRITYLVARLAAANERAEAAGRERDDAQGMMLIAEQREREAVQELAATRQRKDALHTRAIAAEDERDEAVASSAAMRKALETAQWGDHQGPDCGMCPECEGEPNDGFGHFQGCSIGAALAPNAGKALLAVVQSAVRYCEAMAYYETAADGMDSANAQHGLDAAQEDLEESVAALATPQAKEAT